MIFHINLFNVKPGVSDDQREAGLELMRQDAANPAVKSWIVGRVLGGEFEYSAVYVVEDLDGYWAYLTHPAHVAQELGGIPLIEKFLAFDISDSDDPQLGEKINALQARHLQESPELAAREAEAPSFAVPGQPAAADRQPEA